MCWRFGARDKLTLAKLKAQLKDKQLDNIEGTVMAVKHDTAAIRQIVTKMDKNLRWIMRELRAVHSALEEMKGAQPPPPYVMDPATPGQFGEAKPSR